MGIGNFGMWEMLVVGLIVLIFFGPRRLPEIARSAGKAMREFKRGMNEIQRELDLAGSEERKTTAPATKPTSSSTSKDTDTGVASPDTTTPSIQPPIPTFASAGAAAATVTAGPGAEDSTDRTAQSGLYDGTRVDVGGEPTRVEGATTRVEGAAQEDESESAENAESEPDEEGSAADGSPPAESERKDPDSFS